MTALGRRGLDVLGVVLAAAGIVATAGYFEDSLELYDEGILLTNANLLLHGAVPYRDFYANYPPGIFVVIAGLWTLFGTSLAVERWLGFVVHVALAAGAAGLAGRASGRRCSLVTGGAVLLWLSPLGVPAYAWLAALAAAFVACRVGAPLLPRFGAGAPWWRCAAFGAALGAVCILRHDLFVYFALGLAGVELALLAGVVAGGSTPQVSLVAIGWALVGGAAVALPVWGCVLWLAGPSRVAQDLYFDQVAHTMPARWLPLPALTSLESWGSLPLPAFLVALHPGAAMVAFLGPVLGLFLGVRQWSRPDALGGAAAATALSLAMLPPMLGRSDEVHCLYAVAPGLATLGAVLESGATARRPGVGLVAPLLALVLFVLPARDLVPGADAWGRLPFPPPGDRLSGLPRDEREAKQPILDFVAQNVPPGTPIFVGNLQHRLLTFNDTSLYFLTDRPGATRYLQFDPGIVTREDVQRQIVADLEARRPPVAILLDGGYVEEPNESAVPGSPLLDEYLRRRYEAVGSVWRYVLVRRNEP